MSRLVLVPALLVLSSAASAQPEAAPPLRAEKVAEGIHVLFGRGGNIGVCLGPDGTFLVDDQFAPATPEILANVKELGGGDVRFVVNTHWHGDHTGGNENLGKAGAILVAHANVRARLSTEQFQAAMNRRTPPSPPDALPDITFLDGVTFHWNGQTIRVLHLPAAHTDGDSVLHFVEADVIHAGDVVFIGRYPFIDTSSGGSVDGVLAAVDRILEMARPTTRIIPGHGPVTDADGLRAYRTMIAGARERVRALVDGGMSLDEVLAAKPTAPDDPQWGGADANPDRFVRALFEDVTAR